MLIQPVRFNAIQNNSQDLNVKAQENLQQNTNISQPSFQGSIEKAAHNVSSKIGVNADASIKKMLDESKFLLDVGNGKELMSIKEFIQKIVTRVDEQRSFPNMYHASFSKEKIDNIIKNGFDPKCIYRAQNGPGFYFAFAEGQAMMYGSAKLTADLEGKTAIFPPKWYDKITEGTDAIERIKTFTGTNGANSKNDAGQKLNEYVRNLLFKDLGYDMGYANGELICFNPSVIKNIKHF